MIYKGFEIQITVRANCRKLILRHLAGESFFRLSVPPGTRKQLVTDFLKANEAWLRQEMQKTETAWTPSYAPGEIHMLWGKRVVLGEDHVPAGEDFLAWRDGLLLEELKRLIPVWTARMGVTVKKVTIKEMRRQWGSCSSLQHISINARLAMYPKCCTEQVVVHELCHLHHQDHSPDFYKELTSLLPDWRASKEILDKMNVQPMKGTST